MAKPNWINESEAAKLMNYKPSTFRKYVKSGRLDVSWTSVAGRKAQYDQNSIEKLLMKNARLIA